MRGKAIRRQLAALMLVVASLPVSAAPDPLRDAIDHAHYVDALRLDGKVFHVQGLALDGPHIWVTSVDEERHKGYLHEFDRTSGKFLRQIELTDGLRYHPGGISIVADSIWVPVAELKPNSSTTLVEVAADSMAVRRRITVADHLGCVAATGQLLVAGNWDSKLFYILDLTGRTPLRIVANPTGTSYQDMKFVGNQLVASGTLSPWSGSIDWIDWPSMKLVRTLRAGVIGPIEPFGRGGPLTREGMAIVGRELYVLPEDGPSRVIHFQLDV